MKRQALIALKIAVSLPLALVLGGLASKILQEGLWPLLFFPDRWLYVIDIATTAICQLSILAVLIWSWALGR